MTPAHAIRAALAAVVLAVAGTANAATYFYNFDGESGDPATAGLAGVNFIAGDSGAQFGTNLWVKFSGFYTYMSGYALDLPFANTKIELQFDSPASNLSFDLGHTGGGPIQSFFPWEAVALVELFSSGCTGEFCWTTEGPLFGGDDELHLSYAGDGITGVRITYNFGASGVLGIDNLRFTLADGPGPVIPEPSTYALLLAGLGSLGWAARRRRRAPR